jgi:hypothetical protein
VRPFLLAEKFQHLVFGRLSAADREELPDEVENLRLLDIAAEGRTGRAEIVGCGSVEFRHEMIHDAGEEAVLLFEGGGDAIERAEGPSEVEEAAQVRSKEGHQILV